MDWMALIAAAASIVTALLGFFKIREERDRARAEIIRVTAEAEQIRNEYATLAKKSDLDRAMLLVDQLQEDNERLRRHVGLLETAAHERDYEMAEFKVGVLILIEQIRDMGVEPKWKPTYTRQIQAAKVG